MTNRSSARRSGLKFALLATLVVALTATVSACGRKGPLSLPEEVEDPAAASAPQEGVQPVEEPQPQPLSGGEPGLGGATPPEPE